MRECDLELHPRTVVAINKQVQATCTPPPIFFSVRRDGASLTKNIRRILLVDKIRISQGSKAPNSLLALWCANRPRKGGYGPLGFDLTTSARSPPPAAKEKCGLGGGGVG